MTLETTPNEELLTDGEVCGLLRISRMTLHRHLDDSLAGIRRITVGGRRKWVKSSVDEFMQGNHEQTTQE